MADRAPRIGVVEDNAFDVEVFRRAFAPLGALERWPNGEAFAQAQVAEPSLLATLDLLLVDLGLPGIDWDWALVHMDSDLRRAYGEEFLLRGVAHPVTHTLDLAFGYHCTAKVARHVGDTAPDLGEELELPLVAVVEGLAGVLRLVQGLVGLGAEDQADALHETHRGGNPLSVMAGSSHPP